jgi:benzoate transport
MTTDPRSIVRGAAMSAFQVVIISLCVLIAALDGFDVLAIAYTAPSIAHEWNLTPANLGVVFSAGPLGMCIGAAFITPIADRLGRRPVVLFSLLILAVGMLASAFVSNLSELSVMRAFTGIGIGSALASVNVVVAEYASDKRRSLAISLMTIGYPAGATLGGFFSIYLISAHGWRSVYVFGALVAALLLALALRWLPESIDYLMSRRPKNALAKANGIISRMGYSAIRELPMYARADDVPDTSLLTIFRQPYLTSTIASGIAYFGVLFTVYFMLSWTPKLLTELGFSVSGGISGSLLMSMAGVVGVLSYGFAANAIGPRLLAGIFMLGFFLSTAFFGVAPGNTAALLAATLLTGFCLFSSATALYVVVPAAFPSSVRSTGTGFSIGMGRVGAIAAPLVAGLLIGNGWSRAAYCIALAAPALVAAISVRWIGVFDTIQPLLVDRIRPAGRVEVGAPPNGMIADEPPTVVRSPVS